MGAWLKRWFCCLTFAQSQGLRVRFPDLCSLVLLLHWQGNYAVSGGVAGCEAVEAKAKEFKARMTVSGGLQIEAQHWWNQGSSGPFRMVSSSPRKPVASHVRLQPTNTLKSPELTFSDSCGTTGASCRGGCLPHALHGASCRAAAGGPGGHAHADPAHSRGVQCGCAASLGS